MSTKTLIILFLYLFCNSGCNNIPKRVSSALDKAGSNRAELEKVINHYRNLGDDQKLKAAYFLIENMPGKYGLNYSDVDYYAGLSIAIDSFLKHDSCPEYLDRFIADYRRSNANLPSSQPVFDIEVITSDFLIKNIDLAFRVWKEKLWAQHLDFDEFCDWILPYRILNEPLQAWRPLMYNELEHLADSVFSLSDPKEIGLLINNVIARKFHFSSQLGFMPILGGVDLWNVHAGLCEHRYVLITMAMRSMGIPVMIDFTFQYPSFPGNHSWTVLLDKDSRIKPFNGGETEIRFADPAECPIGLDYYTAITTVFRNHFRNINRPGKKMAGLPANLHDESIENVTSQYKGSIKGDFTIALKNPGKSKNAVLFSFGTGPNIIPVASTRAHKNRITFKDIGAPGVYIAGYTNGEAIINCSDPFHWDGEEIRKFYIPDPGITETVILSRKYPVTWPMTEFVSGMIGATIQGSNCRYFSNSDTIFIIEKEINCFREIPVDNKNTYRYFRYESSDMEDIRISSINLNKSGSTVPVTGEVYGFVSDYTTCDDYIFSNAFDKNLRSNFNAPRGSWVALDAGKPVMIESLRIMARNSQNIVEPGDTYELYYFDKGWKSLGSRVADDYHLTYDNVPKEAILLLRNHTKGRQERIFAYNNDEQGWW